MRESERLPFGAQDRDGLSQQILRGLEMSFAPCAVRLGFQCAGCHPGELNAMLLYSSTTRPNSNPQSDQ
jgi:hypothetical protein